MESLNEEKTIDIFGIVPYTFQVMIVTQKYGQNIFLKGGETLPCRPHLFCCRSKIYGPRPSARFSNIYSRQRGS